MSVEVTLAGHASGRGHGPGGRPAQQWKVNKVQAATRLKRLEETAKNLLAQFRTAPETTGAALVLESPWLTPWLTLRLATLMNDQERADLLKLLTDAL